VQSSTPKGDFSERREWPRISLPIPVYIRAQTEGDQAVSELTTAVNISAGGFLIATRRYLASGVPLSVEVPPAPFPSSTGLASSERIFSAKSVRVVSVEGYYLVGIRFDAPLASGADETS